MPMSRAVLAFSASWCLMTLQPAVAQTAQLARAQEIVQGQCFICHGANGESASPAFPRLAGQNRAYLAAQLAAYKSGQRKSSAMQPMVEQLGAADFDALGAYFEKQVPAAHEVEDPELAQVGRFIHLRGNPFSGLAACATCHGVQAQGSEALPRLAGQHAQYLERQLRQFQQRERPSTVMHAISNKLSDLELKSVSSYLSGLK